MTKELLCQIFDWLKTNTNNFEEKPNSLDEVYNCIKRQEEFQKDNLAIAIWFNIFQNHYLTNGNKRLSFILYHWYLDVEEFGEVLNWKYFEMYKLCCLKNELKYLEDK